VLFAPLSFDSDRIVGDVDLRVIFFQARQVRTDEEFVSARQYQ
jgi:hypothetical protein